MWHISKKNRLFDPHANCYFTSLPIAIKPNADYFQIYNYSSERWYYSAALEGSEKILPAIAQRANAGQNYSWPLLLDEPNRINLAFDEKKNLQALSFPWLTSPVDGAPLTFHCDSRKKSFLWAKNPKFAVKTGKRGGAFFAELPNYVILEHQDKPLERKVLLPVLPIDGSSVTPFGSRGKLKISDLKKIIEDLRIHLPPAEQHYAVFNLDPHTQDILPTDLLGKAFLIYLFMHTRKKEKAFLLIQSLSAIDGDGISKKALSLLEKIMEYPKAFSSYTPDCVALALHTALLYYRIVSTKKLDIKRSWAQITETLFCRYLEVFRDVGMRYMLSKTDEKELLSALRQQIGQLPYQLLHLEAMYSEKKLIHIPMYASSPDLSEFAQKALPSPSLSSLRSSWNSIADETPYQEVSKENLKACLQSIVQVRENYTFTFWEGWELLRKMTLEECTIFRSLLRTEIFLRKSADIYKAYTYKRMPHLTEQHLTLLFYLANLPERKIDAFPLASEDVEEWANHLLDSYRPQKKPSNLPPVTTAQPQANYRLGSMLQGVLERIKKTQVMQVSSSYFQWENFSALLGMKTVSDQAVTSTVNHRKTTLLHFQSDGIIDLARSLQGPLGAIYEMLLKNGSIQKTAAGRSHAIDLEGEWEALQTKASSSRYAAPIERAKKEFLLEYAAGKKRLDEPTFSVSSKAIPFIKKTLCDIEDKYKKECAQKLDFALQLANKASDDEYKASVFALKEMGEKSFIIKELDLVRLFLQQNACSYARKNPNLSQEGFAKIGISGIF